MRIKYTKDDIETRQTRWTRWTRWTRQTIDTSAVNYTVTGLEGQIDQYLIDYRDQRYLLER